MNKQVITSEQAPSAIGPYSQAIKVGNTVYLSGQIPLDPATMEVVEGFEAQVCRVFDNLSAVAEAAGGKLQDIVKLNIFLTDLGNFATLTRSWNATSKSPTPPAPPSASPHCPRACRSRWTGLWWWAEGWKLEAKSLCRWFGHGKARSPLLRGNP